MARTAGRQASTAGGGQLDSIRRIRYENCESRRSSSTPALAGVSSPVRIACARSGESVSDARPRSAPGSVWAGRAARISTATFGSRPGSGRSSPRSATGPREGEGRAERGEQRERGTHTRRAYGASTTLVASRRSKSS